MSQKKLRILFRTSGGRAPQKQLGLGHIYRCINLALNLKPNKIYFLVEDYGGSKKILLSKGFKSIFLIRKDVEIRSDIKETTYHIIKNKIDILIVDKYDVKISYLRELKKIVKIVLITDLKKFDYPVDMVINGFVGFKNKIIRNNNSRCLLGPSYQILNNKFAKKPIHKKKYDLLATFGGFDEKNIVNILLKSLVNYGIMIKTKIILGPVTRRTKKIRMLQKKYSKYIHIINETQDMQKEISSARFGICSGGLTTYEFAAVNIPFAIICQVRHQLTTAREWQRLYIASNLGLVNNKTQEKIHHFLKNIIKNKTVPQLNKNPVVDGLGAKRISREILKMKN